MSSPIKQLIGTKDYEGLRQALSRNPVLANAGLPYDEANTNLASPLHRLCDGVFAGTYTADEAVTMAKIFLEYGADINGGERVTKKDTPLIAAASLHADPLAIFYIEQDADIHHAGCHGGTALHWAAWCGRPVLVKRLVAAGAAVNQKCTDHEATPLFWAVHGLKYGGYDNRNACIESVKILVAAGADTATCNIEGTPVRDLLAREDALLIELLRQQ